MKSKYAIVEWKDHVSYANQTWRDLSDAPIKLMNCVSCGWIAHEDDEKITLILTKTQDNFAGDITIAKGLVSKIKRFKWGT